MTGAPKKRSMELLLSMEGEEQSTYSRVMGYWSICGAGNWSMIIRTAFKYDDKNYITRPDIGSATATKESEVWRIGAGGAITALSDLEREWDEMEVKLDLLSLLQIPKSIR
ncbi:ADC synthase [Tirmania nivea]|nr:ADC synthase [Tirmania nivea]